MPLSNALKVDFSNGEIAPAAHGRYDLSYYKSSVGWMQNFIAYPYGSARFRTGTRYVNNTRRNKKAWFIPFQFNDSQSYLIEATDQYFRFYKDGGLITLTPAAITGITQANPAVITSASHGLSVGDEVIITGVVGMVQINNRSLLVGSVTTNTFTVTDQSGTNLNSTGFSAYASGGTLAKVYELKTPYLETDLAELQFTQNADTMYIAHQNYEPRKLTRSGHSNWSLATYTRTFTTTDPFGDVSTKTITGITQANPAVVTAAGHGFTTGDQVCIRDVVGMTQVNLEHYKIVVIGANTFSLQTLAGAAVDSTSYGAYTSGGKAEKYGATNYPRAVTFTDNARLIFAGTKAKPETFFVSKAPTSTTTNYDDFTTGTADTDGMQFTLAPVRGKVDAIQWLTNSDKFILAGTFGTVRRIYGSSQEEPITPTSINAKAVNTYGAKLTRPVTAGNSIFYIQRGGKVLRSFEYDYTVDGYVSEDRNIISKHITNRGLAQIVIQQGDPDIIWAVRTDGVLVGMSYNAKEQKAGWHRQVFTDGKVLTVGVMPREDNYDQLWVVVERVINGVTARYVEYFTDYVIDNDPLEYYREAATETADIDLFNNDLYESKKQEVYVDASLSYDGTYVTTLTPAAGCTTVGTTNVTFTAGAATFDATMVGRELWKNYDIAGGGGGRALITGYTSSTVVQCTILKAFNSATAMAASGWRLTTNTITGLHHLEGMSVQIQTDGAVVDTTITPKTVSGGAVVLDSQASVIHIGIFQRGIIASLPLDQGGATGPAVNKQKNIRSIAMRFVASGGTKYGMTPYELETFRFREGDSVIDRPAPLLTGLVEQHYPDSWDQDKHFYIVQELPLPCQVIGVDTYSETSDD
jgi:hypothetical protein